MKRFSGSVRHYCDKLKFLSSLISLLLVGSDDDQMLRVPRQVRPYAHGCDQRSRLATGSGTRDAQGARARRRLVEE